MTIIVFAVYWPKLKVKIVLKLFFRRAKAQNRIEMNNRKTDALGETKAAHDVVEFDAKFKYFVFVELESLYETS